MFQKRESKRIETHSKTEGSAILSDREEVEV